MYMMYVCKFMCLSSSITCCNTTTYTTFYDKTFLLYYLYGTTKTSSTNTNSRLAIRSFTAANRQNLDIIVNNTNIRIVEIDRIVLLLRSCNLLTSSAKKPKSSVNKKVKTGRKKKIYITREQNR